MPGGVGGCPCPGASAQDPGSAEPPSGGSSDPSCPTSPGLGRGSVPGGCPEPCRPAHCPRGAFFCGAKPLPLLRPQPRTGDCQPLVPQAPCPEPGSLCLGERGGSRQVAPGIWFLDPGEEAPTVAADPPCCWDHSPWGRLGPAGQAAGGEGGAVPAALLPGTPFSGVNGASSHCPVDAGGVGAGSRRPAPWTEMKPELRDGAPRPRCPCHPGPGRAPCWGLPRAVWGIQQLPCGAPPARCALNLVTIRVFRLCSVSPGQSHGTPLTCMPPNSVLCHCKHRIVPRETSENKSTRKEKGQFPSRFTSAFAEPRALPLCSQVLVRTRLPEKRNCVCCGQVHARLPRPVDPPRGDAEELSPPHRGSGGRVERRPRLGVLGWSRLHDLLPAPQIQDTRE